MEVRRSKSFAKEFRRLARSRLSFKKSFEARVGIFIQDRRNPLIRDHGLKGNKIGFRSFSITGDIRVIYYEVHEDGELVCVFIHVGTHSQVY